ncbi:mucoidy inhibitor-like protein [Metarhizium brunneum]
MDPIHKIEYKLRDLGTRSVTLFPTRAQIQRDIKSSGTNEITIFGLSPTVDEDSVKVEGRAGFTISDVSVEQLPNREIFEEVYPEPDSDDSDESDDDDLDDRRWKEGPELKAAKEELTQLEDARRRADETVASAESRLKLLDAYGKTLDKKRGVVIEDSLETYKSQRSKAYDDYMTGLKQQRGVSEKIEDQIDQVYQLQKMDDKERVKAERAKERIRKARSKDMFKKARRQEEQRKEKNRVRKEREKYWPKYCYAVRITLETDTFTPSSSRRTSMSSETRVSKPVVDDTPADEAADGEITLCDLVLSYVTSSASWSPTYDLQLSTTSATGTLSFDAELHNSTSETWSNCKVVLSTSQATFSGLDDAIPTLNPWYISLAHGAPPFGYSESHERIARSGDEVSNTGIFLAKQKQIGPHKARSEMFGIPDGVQSIASFQAGKSIKKKQRALAAQYSSISATPPTSFPVAQCAMPPPPPAQPAGASLFGAPASDTRGASGPLFGGAPSSSTAGFGSAAPGVARARMLSSVVGRRENSDMLSVGGGGGDDDGDEDHEEESDSADSIMEETGLTSTYELPGLRTLIPKSTATKQRVAHVHFSNIAYSHTVVAKYKPVAFLKAKFKNTSKMTLFKGCAGLTLDGSFMGRTSLPRCSAGETFTLSLGIDPAIKVTYPKPVVQRATAGLFSKENTAMFTRTIMLHNTRASAGKPTSLLVLDQVPVSQDEKLKVEVLNPQGMSLGGGEVRAGAPGLEARDNKDWGSAKASLKKDGEVNWDVSLNAGKAVRLTLEYAIAFPTGTYPC